MRMRQSLAEIEDAFVEELEEDRERAEWQRAEAERRTRRRQVERVHRNGSLRFVLVLAVLIATAVIVAVAMFQTLYVVMGFAHTT